MRKKCPNCDLVNFAAAENCLRCEFDLIEIVSLPHDSMALPARSLKLLKRAGSCVLAVVVALAGFYFSLVFSAEPLEYEEKEMVRRAISVLEERGFSREVFVLRHLTVYRGSDNWLNASTRQENAYAAANFPLEIMTLYPDFFTYPLDDTERAAILLHEAQHLLGADEKKAYEFVWKNRQTLGWTREEYGGSIVWRNVRRQTKEVVPGLFVCSLNEYADCTELR